MEPWIRIVGFGGMVLSAWIKFRRLVLLLERSGEYEVRVVKSEERVNVWGL